MKSIFPALLTICSTVTTTSSYETDLAIKTGTRDYHDSVAIGVDTYKDLIKNSKMFVDNSVFIDECLSTTDHLHIIGPKKWGKTLNLDMLKTFLEIQLDDHGNKISSKNSTSNYRLFVNGEITNEEGEVERLKRPLLIAQYTDTIQTYLGNYPVVYVDFRSVSGSNYTAIVQSINRAIKRAYEQHKYMIEGLRRISLQQNSHNRTKKFENYLHRFQNVLSNNMNDKDLPDAIKFLCELLHRYFNQLPFVMFDHYDEAVTNIFKTKNYPINQTKDLISFVDTLIATSLNNDYVEKAIIVGTFELSHDSNLHQWNSYTLADITKQSHPITEYFGFNYEDVDSLFRRHKLDDHLKEQGHIWYNGFKSQSTKRRIHSSFSIVNFLKHKTPSKYWLDHDDDILAKQLLSRNYQTRSEMLSLISKQTLRFHGQRGIVGNSAFGWTSTDDYKACYDFIWYLFKTGYLSYHVIYQDQKPVPNGDRDQDIRVTLPNIEITSLIIYWLIWFYQLEYSITDHLLEDAATKLSSFVNDEYFSTEPLEISLAELYRRSTYPEVEWHKSRGAKENPIISILTCVTLKMQSQSFYEIDVYYNKIVKSDIFIANHRLRKGFFVAIKYHNKFLKNHFKITKTRRELSNENLNHLDSSIVVIVHIHANQTIKIVKKLED